MPEAVIVDAVRTPIGRAFKGSLAQLRPDEMGAFVLDALLERNPGVDPALIEDVVLRRRPAPGSAGLQPGPDHGAALRAAPRRGERRHRLALLRLQPRDHPPGRQRGPAGQGDAYVAAGVEWVSRYNESVEGARPQDQNEKLQGKNGESGRLHQRWA